MTELKKGDIIRYNVDDISVIHRIKSIEFNILNEKYYTTKGDNNQSVDIFPVTKEQITGKYCLRIPYIGYPTLILGELLSNKSEISSFIEIG